MSRLNQTFLLYIIILIEGYIVLSAELIAMRQTIAYVGSGTDTVSIIIAAVLMPLAFGYQFGGRYKQKNILGQSVTIRKKLIKNILIAGIILLPGLSYVTIQLFFYYLGQIGLSHRIYQTVIYSCVFIVVPVFLLGQTIPLVSNYFSKEKLAQITGKMLCFSTLGSFLGAVFSTIALMPTIGVNNTVSLIFVLMACLIIMLSKKKFSEQVMYGIALAALALIINSNQIMIALHVVKANKYNDLVVVETPSGNRHLFMNGNDSSMYNEFGDKHAYVEFAESITVKKIMNSKTPKDILVVGAGAFTFGHEDENNNYVYVDLDGDLDEVAEKYILKEKIKPNKKFEVMDVRAYLRANPDKKFDLIYLDAYLGGLSIPESLVTREFFIQVKDALKDKGILLTNFIASPNFASKFSRSLDNTFRDVFPHVSRFLIKDQFDVWESSDTNAANISYIYRHETDYKMGSLYTDDKNTMFLEKPKKLGK